MDIKYKRIAFYKVKKIMEEYRIPILIGLRRTGKTTILNQIKNEDPDKSIQIRFDSLEIRAMNTLEVKKYIINLIDKGYKKFLFDEIQVRSDWAILIKDLFDEYVEKKAIKIAITGSSSLTFENIDTGVDRTEKVLISTLDFDEYCNLTLKAKTKENFECFLGNGPFPGYVNSNKNMGELISLTLEPILNDDIPSQYKISADNMIRLLKELASLTNGEFNKNRSSKNTGISNAQIDKYIDILVKTQIIKKVLKIDENGNFGKYSSYKIYINPHFHLWLLGQKFSDVSPKLKGHIVESYWLFASTQINGYYKKFLYMKSKNNNQEIDFVSINNSTKGPKFKTLHEFKYSLSGGCNNLFKITPSINKVIWYLGKSKLEQGIKYENILEFKNPSNLKS